MTDHMTSAEYRELLAKPKRSRERNIKKEYDGRMYDSGIQANYAAELDIRKRAGEIANWIPEVSFPLPGGVRCRPDFMIIHKILPDGKFIASIEDVKALIRKTGKPRISQEAKNKYKQMPSEYGIEVIIIPRKR